jgi:hypothetical protein
LSVPNVKTEVDLEKLKRVALKMAVGLAELLKFPLSLEADTVQYLFGAYDSDSTVLADFTVHESLESLRPPLSHTIFIKGNRRTRYSYAIVQFYGMSQFYIVLAERDYGGGFRGNRYFGHNCRV